MSKTGTGSYGYNDAAHKHAVTHLDGVQRYWYDANGNMTTRIENGVTYQQTFDIENRLSTVTANGQTTTFTYDGDGARVKKVDASGTTYTPGEYYEVSNAVVSEGGICSGMTIPGNTNWQVYTNDAIYLDVDTSACGLSSTPLYFTSMGGDSSHWTTQGATSIYMPTATGFRVYVYQPGITPAQANTWKWHLSWRATPANLVTPGLCTGRTTPGSTNWQAYGSDGIYLDVDTSACSLSSTPLYLTSLGGDGGHWTTQGATSIYMPTATGFRVYVYQPGITPAQANTWKWHLNWMAVPPSTSPGACAGQTAPGSTNWQEYYGIGVYVVVDTSACGLSSTPRYFTSIGGNANHWMTQGATSIYAPTHGQRIRDVCLPAGHHPGGRKLLRVAHQLAHQANEYVHCHQVLLFRRAASCDAHGK